MADTREIYNQAMNKGDDAAWDHDWKTAISAYARAVQTVPDDPRAHTSLGLALLQAKRFEDSLKVYQRAHQLSPDDPVPLEKSADVLERMGRLREAAQQYVSVADIYLAQRDLDKAIGNWERATRLTPGLLQIHLRLAQSYERIGQKKSAIREYLTLAFNFRAGGDLPKAKQAVERALRLDPINPQALNTKQALESGGDVFTPKNEENDRDLDNLGERKSGFEAGQNNAQTSDADPRGPIGEATELALSDLAEFLLNNDLTGPMLQAIQAIELQKAGDHAGAITLFRTAEAGGVRHPALAMSLGSMYVADGNWQAALDPLNKARNSNTYASGAVHGLGQAYYGLGNQREAASHLLNALRLVDTGLAMTPDEAAQIEAVYKVLSDSLFNLAESDLARMNVRFSGWLGNPDWKRRIVDSRRDLQETLSSEGVTGLAQAVSEGGDKVTTMVGNVDRYMKQHLYVLAIDEAFHAIEIAPTYLPVHLRIAQILMEEGSIQPAITKYNMVANSFLARNETARAAEILNEVISIAPTDTNLRSSLIALLEKEERWPEVLDQYIHLADAHYQLTDFEQARTTYQEAMRLAQRVNADAGKRAEIMHRIADIDLSRLDLRQALRTYEQIRTISPNDERARRALIDLNYRLNNGVEAIKELDGLLRVYAQGKRGDLIVSLLEEFVTRMPTDMALRSRLAAVYRQVKRIPDAVRQLDALGELQLNAGLLPDACATIKQIVVLQPNDSTAYRELLSQLNCP